MYYSKPTKRGLGVELWGTYDDLRTIYEVIDQFWNNDDYSSKKDFNNRDQLISGFLYEIRKAYEGKRLRREDSHFSLSAIEHFGCQLSWVHILFSLTTVRYNMRFFETDKLDLATMLQLEYWLEKSMLSFDEAGGKALQYYISDGLYQGNPYAYQFMRSINAEYFQLGGSKTSFRKLPTLLRRAVYGTEEYNMYLAFLTSEALRLECDISELEINDDDLPYEKAKW